MATHPSILAWKIPRTEEPGGHGIWGHKESGMTKRLSTQDIMQRNMHGLLTVSFHFMGMSNCLCHLGTSLNKQ